MTPDLSMVHHYTQAVQQYSLVQWCDNAGAKKWKSTELYMHLHSVPAPWADDRCGDQITKSAGASLGMIDS